jgi:hypothetical protein
MRTGVVRAYDFASPESIAERATEDLLNASKMASFREVAYCLDEKFDPTAA